MKKAFALLLPIAALATIWIVATAAVDLFLNLRDPITAAWVQAVGTVAAIWGAARIIVIQAREAKLDEVAATAAILCLAYNEIRKASDKLQARARGEPVDLGAERLVDVRRWLEAASPQQLSTPELVDLIFDMLDLVRRSIQSLETASAARSSKDVPSLVDTVQVAAKVLDRAQRMRAQAYVRRSHAWLW